MNRRMLLLAAGVAGAVGIAAPLSALPPGTENFNKTGSSPIAEKECTNGDYVAIFGPEALWPPNHKYYDDIWAVGERDNEAPLTLQTTGTHDQYEGDVEDSEANGSGHTADDITLDPGEDAVGAPGTSEDGAYQFVATEDGEGTVRTDWRARAERSGVFKEGRTYTLTATIDGSPECTVSASFVVPHDMRPANRNGGEPQG